MSRPPAPPPGVATFLAGRRLAVAGVSREPGQAANAIFRKLVAGGYDVYPVNPRAREVEGRPCFPDLAALPEAVDGVVVATPPAAAAAVVRSAAETGVPRVWLHRSLGTGSVSDAAVREAEARGIDCLVGGCPLMYCAPVDPFHRCLRWWLGRRGRLPR